MLPLLWTWEQRLSSPWAAESNLFTDFSNREAAYKNIYIHGILRGCLQPSELFSVDLTGVGWEREEGVPVLPGISLWHCQHPKAGALPWCWPLFLCCWFGLKRNLVSS